MLQVAQLRTEKERAIDGLKKRNIAEPEKLIGTVISLDDERKDLQTQLDAVLAESNQIAKSIGALMQQGKKEEAEQVKAKTSELKQQSKNLQEALQSKEQALQDILYQIPNIPFKDVKEGKGADDNEVMSEHGEKPTLYEGKTPHWELIKKYDIIDFDL